MLDLSRRYTMSIFRLGMLILFGILISAELTSARGGHGGHGGHSSHGGHGGGYHGGSSHGGSHSGGSHISSHGSFHESSHGSSHDFVNSHGSNYHGSNGYAGRNILISGHGHNNYGDNSAVVTSTEPPKKRRIAWKFGHFDNPQVPPTPMVSKSQEDEKILYQDPLVNTEGKMPAWAGSAYNPKLLLPPQHA